jgi:hypothetical protein
MKPETKARKRAKRKRKSEKKNVDRYEICWTPVFENQKEKATMNIDELTLGQVKELRGMFGGACAEPTGSIDVCAGSKTKILILQRGWVYVGKPTQAGNIITLHDAKCIRIWGTTNGIGELAEKGPLEKTKLDSCPDVRCHVLTTVAIVDCNDAKW